MRDRMRKVEVSAAEKAARDLLAGQLQVQNLITVLKVRVLLRFRKGPDIVRTSQCH